MLSDILEENPSESINVFVVWFEVLGPDTADQVDTSLLDDARAVHYWDSGQEVSDFLSAHAAEIGLPDDELLWDAYLLFAAESVWEEIPTRMVGFGAPVINGIKDLSAQLDGIWGRS